MASVIEFQKGDTAFNDALTLPTGQLSIDTQAGNIRVHDGETQGGHPTENFMVPE